MSNYYFFRYLIKIIKINYNFNFYRAKTQPFNQNLFFPGSFIKKRMFLKHVFLKDILYKNNANYS
jgi:hypothetical protein